MFVECSECGKREYRKWDNTLPPGGLSCCSNSNCMALPESESFAVRPRVFCASMADWLDNEVPIDWLVDLLDLIRQTPNLDWLLLTKRIGNLTHRLEHALEHLSRFCSVDFMQGMNNSCTISAIQSWLRGPPPENVWIGATVVNQAEADRDIPKLLQVPARIRFLSVEPMLGNIDLSWIPIGHQPIPGNGAYLREQGISWVICGGESGPHARPAHPDWFRSLRDQCSAACVPFFFKQWGEWEIASAENGHHDQNMVRNNANWVDVDGTVSKPSSLGLSDNAFAMVRVGKKRAGCLLDGREHKEFPGDLSGDLFYRDAIALGILDGNGRPDVPPRPPVKPVS